MHLTEKDFRTLFGDGASLTQRGGISQPGQFAAVERVTVSGQRGEIPGVIILGPLRDFTQVELSYTDARRCGIDAPLRETGVIAGSAPCTLTGPAGSLKLACGTIISQRHIHMTPAEAERYGFHSKQTVSVKIDTDGRSVVYGDVIVRISPNFSMTMYVDTDEANAAGISGACTGTIIG